MTQRFSKRSVTVYGMAGFLALTVIGWIVARTYHRIRNRPRVHTWLDLKHIAARFRYYKPDFSLPPASILDEDGKPMHSWRVLILARKEKDLYKQYNFNEPWDGPNNRWLANKGAHHYSTSFDNTKVAFQTAYMAITGPGTAFDPNKSHSRIDLPPDTILVVKVKNSGIHWMEPRDLSIDEITDEHDDMSISSSYGERVVLFADGQVWFLKKNVPFEDLKKFFTIEGAKKYERDEVLGPYKADWPLGG